jgi:hypothetical protein
MIYPESIGKVKVGDLVAFNCRDLDGSTAMGIVVAMLAEANRQTDVKVKWFEYKGSPAAVATHYEYELLVIKKDEKASSITRTSLSLRRELEGHSSRRGELFSEKERTVNEQIKSW